MRIMLRSGKVRIMLRNGKVRIIPQERKSENHVEERVSLTRGPRSPTQGPGFPLLEDRGPYSRNRFSLTRGTGFPLLEDRGPPLKEQVFPWGTRGYLGGFRPKSKISEMAPNGPKWPQMVPKPPKTLARHARGFPAVHPRSCGLQLGLELG